MKTYILVAALTLGAVALPNPASALYCMPIGTDELVQEVRCWSGIDRTQCTGELASECAAVLALAGSTFDTAEAVEDVVRGLPNKVHPGIKIHPLP